jgi:hypothetical protein
MTKDPLVDLVVLRVDDVVEAPTKFMHLDRMEQQSLTLPRSAVWLSLPLPLMVMLLPQTRMGRIGSPTPQFQIPWSWCPRHVGMLITWRSLHA